MKSVTKIALNIVGSISLLLAVAGIFLPLLPTTPFLLLASACYLRGSDRLHGWLMSNKLFGKYIENIQQNKGIPLRAKIITIALLWLSVFFSIHRLNIIFAQVLLLVIGIGVSVFLLRMKTYKEQE